MYICRTHCVYVIYILLSLTFKLDICWLNEESRANLLCYVYILLRPLRFKRRICKYLSSLLRIRNIHYGSLLYLEKTVYYTVGILSHINAHQRTHDVYVIRRKYTSVIIFNYKTLTFAVNLSRWLAHWVGNWHQRCGLSESQAPCEMKYAHRVRPTSN